MAALWASPQFRAKVDPGPSCEKLSAALLVACNRSEHARNLQTGPESSESPQEWQKRRLQITGYSPGRVEQSHLSKLKEDEWT